jgi:hypothetical protein
LCWREIETLGSPQHWVGKPFFDSSHFFVSNLIVISFPSFSMLFSWPASSRFALRAASLEPEGRVIPNGDCMRRVGRRGKKKCTRRLTHTMLKRTKLCNPRVASGENDRISVLR